MKARDAIGKRIVGIHQERIWDEQLGHSAVALLFIELEGGKRIIFNARENEVEPYVVGWVD